MARRPVRAITFDLWDCLFIDNSDEPKRALAGEMSKREARRDLVCEALTRRGPTRREDVALAYDVTDAAFRKVWVDQHVTWTVRERLGVLLSGLSREAPEEEFSELIRLHEEMELAFRPDPVRGVHEALTHLARQYRLAVVSDAIFTPGRALRQLLKAEGLFDFFEAFVFSDEVGWSKPAPQVFEDVGRLLGVSPQDLVHIGDRPHTDVDGAHNVGARAVLLTAVKDRGSKDSDADAICDDYSKLPSIIEEMDGQPFG